MTLAHDNFLVSIAEILVQGVFHDLRAWIQEGNSLLQQEKRTSIRSECFHTRINTYKNHGCLTTTKHKKLSCNSSISSGVFFSKLQGDIFQIK